MKKIFLFTALLFALNAYTQDEEQSLYQSYDVTEDSVFLPWAEGPDVDLDGVASAEAQLDTLARDRTVNIDTDALADTFRDAGFETGMRAADLWPAAWE